MKSHNIHKEIDELLTATAIAHERLAIRLRQISEQTSRTLQQTTKEPLVGKASISDSQSNKINNSGFSHQALKISEAISRLKSAAGRAEYKKAINDFRTHQKKGLSLDSLAKIRDETPLHIREASRQIQSIYNLFNAINLGKNPFTPNDFIAGWSPRF